ncbi:hypothetical protein GO013_05640 [Pseudodesulfovibrio sp. JC047]|uniref:hypothetical protein n=1 Tax=Pseudodesulfovibrio sp. JC047 TaxID=2683199 RepID=UPI0013D6FF61|nr:hypothetical protein [Pseudodesulfovibrio sp. JC047]NDV18901.1 hypothetical protein [Pseudodesulfovibrio sp. JC047]
MMLDLSNVIPHTLTRLKKLTPGQGLVLLTYKRDRFVRIVKDTDTTCTVTESGFYHTTVQTDISQIKKQLKTLLKREFPRSRKVRIHPVD